MAKGSKSAVWADLRGVLAGRDFRRLLATRLISQAGDGVVTAGVGTYVFFNATTFPSPTAGAAAFAVLYLPYSFIGPFAGVFIDRWSRRQILVWSALIRAAFVVVTAAVMAAGNRGVLIAGQRIRDPEERVRPFGDELGELFLGITVHGHLPRQRTP